MVIYNSKEIKTSYMHKDNLVVEIRCTFPIDELLEKLRKGEEIPENSLSINSFKTGDGKVITQAEYEMADEFNNAKSKYGYDSNIRLELLNDLEDTYQNKENERPEIFQAYEAFQFNRTWRDYEFTRCEITREDLLKQLYAAIGIMPTIKDIPERSINELRKMSIYGDRLYWPFSEISHTNKLPSRADIEFYSSLSDYEKRLINESNVHPMKLLDLARSIKEQNRGSFLTKNLVLIAQNNEIENLTYSSKYPWVGQFDKRYDLGNFDKDIPLLYYLSKRDSNNLDQNKIYLDKLISIGNNLENGVYPGQSFERFAQILLKERVFSQELLDKNKDVDALYENTIKWYRKIYKEEFLPKFTKEITTQEGKTKQEISYTENDIYSFAKRKYEMPMPKCIQIADKLFKDMFKGHAPKVLFEYMYAQFQANKINPDTATEKQIKDIVEKFNQKNVALVAKYKSPILFALADKINYNEIKEDYIQALAIFVSYNQIQNFINKGFVEWFKENKDTNISNFVEMLELSDRIQKFDSKKSAKELTTEILMGSAIKDCKAMEQKYGYKFSDNEIAIRGRHVIAKEGKMKMYMLPADDYRNFTVGDATDCCQHYGGAGESCVWKYTTDPFAACVVVERDGKILAQGFVWTDEAKDTLVFDNVEFADDRKVSQFTSIFAAWAKAIPYKNVHVGTGCNSGMRTWGKGVTFGADIPTTLDGTNKSYGRHIYTDYRSSDARSIKANGQMQIKETTAVKVTTKPDEPTKWDDLARPEIAFLLNDWQTPIEERMAFARDFLNEQTPEIQMRAVQKNINAIKAIENPTEEVQLYVVRQNPKNAELIQNPCTQVQELLIQNNPEYIRNVSNPTESMQRIAVEYNGLLLSKIENPSPLIVRLAVEQNGYAIRFVNNPDEETQLAAVRSNAKVVSLIHNPTERVLRQAVRRDPSVVALLEHPTRAIELEAVELDPNVINSLKNPSYEAIKRAIELNGLLIRKFQHQYPHLKAVAIKQNPYAIRAIVNPTEEEYILAVRKNSSVANLIRNPEVRRNILNEISKEKEECELDLD